MTSQINPQDINGNYPVAGQPNNTKGFRDNFTNTKTNFEYAANEITELQNKVVLKQALTGGVLDNNMNDALIYGAKIRDFSATLVQVTTTSGPVSIDYTAGHYQTINTTGSIGLGFFNWPANNSAGWIRLTINITDIAHTVTLPNSVTSGLVGLQGYSAGVISFGAIGTYSFDFVTYDNGNNITIQDLNRPLNVFTNGIASSSATTGIGYATGAGGTVTQLTSKITGVTLNNVSGEITMNNASLDAATTVNFTLTNSAIAATDLLVINQASTANAGGYCFNAICNAGNAQVSVRNIMAASASDAVVLRYAVVKAVTS
jgi:hypothetical protein